VAAWRKRKREAQEAAARTRQAERKVYHRSHTVEWETPQAFFDQLDAEFGFTLDVAAQPGNAKCARYFTPEDDGLAQPWAGVCWMNPPYGPTLDQWIRKAYESAQAGATVVCLVPARTEMAWWHTYAVQGEVRFIRGRLKFGGAPYNAPFPSALIIFRPPGSREAPLEAQLQGYQGS
jgi:phage N-6-adenine-methyltransferase